MVETVRRIFLTRAFLLGAVAALVLGASLATLTSSSGTRPNDAPITVPVGRIGDRAVYALHAPSTQAEIDWAIEGPLGIGHILLALPSGGAPSQRTAQGARVFEVAAAVSAYDAAHVRHDALIIAENHTLPKDPSFRYTLVEHVDLDTRTVFRTDENVAAPRADRRTADPGTSGAVQTSTFDIHDPTLPGLDLQGKTLRLGEVLREGPADVPASRAGVAQQVHEKVWVAERQLIDGIDAYAVRREYTYKAALLVPAAAGSAARPTEASESFEVRVWIVDWMSASSAYSILREAGAEVLSEKGSGPAPSHSLAYRLMRVEPGGEFIRWAPHDAPHWAAARTDLERSPSSQHHPADGTGSSLRHPLGAALQSVESDLTLLGYRAWKQAHPSAILIGARYSVAEARADPAQLPGATWTLLFASQSGEGFVVVSIRDPQSDAVRNTATGAYSVPPFSTGDLPTSPPTLGALERSWGDYVSTQARATGFNYIRWGIDPSGAKPGCVSDAGYLFGLSVLELLNLAEAGHQDPAAATSCPIQSAGSSLLFLDVRDGRAVGVQESEGRRTVAEAASDGSFRSGWSRAASTVPAGVRPPTPAETATSSLGLLAMFAAAYFWPTLKFVGAKAVLVAGYAKIAKDDLLNNPVREQILHLIRNVPGIHASDIGRQVNVGWGTVVYHLSVLERNKVVTSLVDGRHKRFFPADTVDYSKRGQLAALMNANTRSIYEMIEGTPGIIQGQLASKAELTVPTVIWHLQRLEEAGLVGRDKQGRTFHYFANPAYQPKKPEPRDSMEVQ